MSSVEGFLDAAAKHIATGDYRSAEQSIRDGLRLQPRNPEIRTRLFIDLADAYVGQGYNGHALRVCNQAFCEADSTKNPLVFQERVFRRLDCLGRDLCYEIVSQNTNHQMDAVRETGHYAVQTGSLDIEQIAFIYNELAYASNLEERTQQVLESARMGIQVQAQNPDINASLHRYVGQSFLDMGKHEEAVASGSEIIKLNPVAEDLKEAGYTILAKAYNRMGRHAEALEVTESASKTPHTYSSALKAERSFAVSNLKKARQ